MNKKVSIIIPVYNAERTLSRTLDSILSQTYNNFEIILVNDGSKDRSIDVCNRYKDKDDRIVVIDKKNGGPSSARNEGLKKATGIYVQFVDSDDELDNNYTEKMISYFNKGNNIDLVVSAIKIITKKKDRDVEFSKTGIFNNEQMNDVVNQQNFYGLIASPCNKIYIREKVKNGFPIEIKNGEDAIFNLEYLKTCKNIFLTNNETYNYFYENPNSLTKKFSDKRFLDSLVAREKLKSFFKELGLDGAFVINRLLLRDVCSLTKSLIKEKNMSRKQKLEKVKEMIENEQVRVAVKKYNALGIVEKIAFWLIKKKRIKLFYACCKLK